MKKLLSLLLIMATVASFAACVGGKDNSDETTNGATNETVIGDTGGSDSEVKHNLPEDLKYDGEKIRIRYPSEVVDEFFFNETPLNKVDEAVYRSNKAVQDCLDVVLEVTTAEGWESLVREEYERTIWNAYYTQSGEWDMVGIISQRMPLSIRRGVFRDLNELEYFDFSKDYWLKSLLTENTVDGRLYSVAGDVSLSLTKMINIILFNRELAKEQGIGDIQKVALDGGWTKDLLKQYAVAAFKGPDPTNPVLGQDTFGLASSYTANLRGFHHSFYVNGFVKDAEGNYDFVYGNERAVDAVAYMCDLFNNHPGIVTDVWENRYADIRNAFIGGSILFMASNFSDITNYYGDITGEYGILPMPKWDENEEYATNSNMRFIAFSIMRGISDERCDMLSAVLECIASESYNTIVPAYFEESLKIRYTDPDDEDSVLLFDLIRDSVTLEIGVLYGSVIGQIDTDWERVIYQNKPDWASYMEGQRSKYETGLQSYLDSVREIELEA